MNEPTPRTDAEASDGWSGEALCVGVEFAMKLERELAAMTARAEAAEALVAEKDKALQYALGWIDKAMTDEVIASAWNTISARLVAARDLTPEGVGAEMARLREELTDTQVKKYLSGQALEDVRRERDALRARVAELEHDRNISAASADLLADDVKEAADRMEKAEARAERLADALRKVHPENLLTRLMVERTIEAALADQPAQASAQLAAPNPADSHDLDGEAHLRRAAIDADRNGGHS